MNEIKGIKGLRELRGLTGIKDQDREILLNIEDDFDILKVSSLNKYFYYEICNDMFFRNRLARTYPETLKTKPEDKTWKSHFINYIKHKKYLDYIYGIHITIIKKKILSLYS